MVSRRERYLLRPGGLRGTAHAAPARPRRRRHAARGGARGSRASSRTEAGRRTGAASRSGAACRRTPRSVTSSRSRSRTSRLRRSRPCRARTASSAPLVPGRASPRGPLARLAAPAVSPVRPVGGPRTRRLHPGAPRHEPRRDLRAGARVIGQVVSHYRVLEKLGGRGSRVLERAPKSCHAVRQRACSSLSSSLSRWQRRCGLSRCVAVYLPTLLPSLVPTSVLWRQCMPPHTRALPSSAWISAMVV